MGNHSHSARHSRSPPPPPSPSALRQPPSPTPNRNLAQQKLECGNDATPIRCKSQPAAKCLNVTKKRFITYERRALREAGWRPRRGWAGWEGLRCARALLQRGSSALSVAGKPPSPSAQHLGHWALSAFSSQTASPGPKQQPLGLSRSNPEACGHPGHASLAVWLWL